MRNLNRRVAMISEHASPLAYLGSEDSGGQNVYVTEVSMNLASLGYHVDVFTRWDSEYASQVNALNGLVRVINLRAGPGEYIKKDAIWPYMPAFVDSFLHFYHSQGVPYQVVHGNFWMSGWVGCQLKRRLHVPVVQIFHALGKIKRLYQGGKDTSPRDRIRIEQRIVRDVDRIIAQCPSEVEELSTLYSADEEKVVVIPSAVNTAAFHPVNKALARQALGLPLDERIVVYVGRMLPRKGIDNLTRGFAEAVKRSGLPCRLLLVGGETEDADPDLTPEIGRIAELAETLGIRHLVQFVGKRPQKNLVVYYSAADVSVTTPWYEPFGLTPLEAMACGTPVVGSAVGGIKFTVLDGQTGFLVPPRDPSALSEKLELLFADAALRERLGRKARMRVETTFTWSRVAEQVAEVYDELLSEQRQVMVEETAPKVVLLPKMRKAKGGLSSGNVDANSTLDGIGV